MTKKPNLPRVIISGGQTGADIGGLVGAKRAGVITGGCAPKGFKTEKGPQVDALKAFGLREHPLPSYDPRTLVNVLESDGTAIFATKPNSEGTELTVRYCVQEAKPYLLIDPFVPSARDDLIEFVSGYNIETLNVAGNRESVSPGIAKQVAQLINGIYLC